MKLEQSFEVAAPLDRVWAALIDVERVAPCLPGAEVTGRNDDGSYNGSFRVKIGPTAANYAGKLEMENVDEGAHTATMQAAGTDRRGQGGAKATIVSSVREGAAGVSVVDVSTDYSITGRLARFGRGGMIEEIGNQLLKEFATSLQAMLAGPGDYETFIGMPAVGADAAAAPEKPARKPRKDLAAAADAVAAASQPVAAERARAEAGAGCGGARAEGAGCGGARGAGAGAHRRGSARPCRGGRGRGGAGRRHVRGVRGVRTACGRGAPAPVRARGCAARARAGSGARSRAGGRPARARAGPGARSRAGGRAARARAGPRASTAAHPRAASRAARPGAATGPRAATGTGTSATTAAPPPVTEAEPLDGLALLRTVIVDRVKSNPIPVVALLLGFLLLRRRRRRGS